MVGRGRAVHGGSHHAQPPACGGMGLGNGGFHTVRLSAAEDAPASRSGGGGKNLRGAAELEHAGARLGRGRSGFLAARTCPETNAREREVTMNTTWSRREFLELSSAAAWASLGKTTPRARRVPPSDTVRFGMVGVGMQGSGLLGESIRLPGVVCAGAADLYDGRHTLAREIAGATLPVTRRYQQLLDDKTIDCIVAAVPDHWHRRMVVEAVSAGKDIYIEKPMSHTAADGVAMVDAVKKSGRILQVGSQRVSSQICAKAKEMIAQGMLGDLTLVEGWLGRNDPTGAWEYPPPPDLSLQTLDWDTWQNDVPKRPLDPNIFARWRCWKEYGTGVAGDLLVHLISGMQFMLGINEPPKLAASVGGIRRFKDGRNMPDVHATIYYYGADNLPVYMRLNL